MRQNVSSQVLLEFSDAAAQHVSLAPDVEAGVVVGGFDPVDLGESSRTQLLRRSSSRGARAFAGDPDADDFLLGPLERAIKTRVVEWLEQIVERSGLEGAQRVLIVGRDEDDRGGRSPPKHSSTSKPSHSGICTSRKSKSGLRGGSWREPPRRSRIRRRFQFRDRAAGGRRDCCARAVRRRQINVRIFRGASGRTSTPCKGTETETSTPPVPDSACRAQRRPVQTLQAGSRVRIPMPERDLFPSRR